MTRPTVSTGFWFPWLLSVAMGCLAVAGHPPSVLSAEPLHVRIDHIVAQSHVGQIAPIADDAAFARRIYLDLAGRIPSSGELRSFLSDAASDKRAQLVNRLLDGPDYGRHLADRFDVMLMERRADKHVPSAEWRQYLESSLTSNKPWDQLAREILGADGADDKLRPAAKFYLDRDGEPNRLTRDVGRIFLGVDLECAQCHNHPLIDDYYQRDYYGIYAFLGRGFVFEDKQAKKSFYAEKAEGDIGFTSVFTKESGKTGPRLPGGVAIDEPAFAKGDEYQIKPAADVRPIPKFSRRGELARRATDGSNALFNRNIANRLWALMMGRGLVEPVDLHHTDNAAAAPQLLELLAAELVTMKFDVKAFLRELALSNTYQQSLEMPAGLSEQANATAGHLSELTAEASRLNAVATDSAAAWEKLAGQVDEARKATAPVDEEFTKADVAATDARNKLEEAAKALRDAQQGLASRQDLLKALTEASEKAAAAAAKLPEEKDLAAAAEKFATRATTVSGEIDAATKDVEAKAGQVPPATTNLAAAQKVLDEVRARWLEANRPVHVLDEQLSAALSRRNSDKLAAAHAQRRVKLATALLGYSQQLSAATVSRAAAERLRAELAAAEQQVAEAAQLRGTRASELVSVQQMHQSAGEALAASQQELDTRKQTANAVSEAAATAEAVKQKLPDDKDLAAVAEQLKARSDKATQESAAGEAARGEREAALKAMAEQLVTAQQALTAAEAQLATATQRVVSLQQQVSTAVQQANADETQRSATLAELTALWSDGFAVAPLAPLTPEQLGWSMLQATGQIDRQWTASEAELNAKSPLTDEMKNDPAQLAERRRQIGIDVREKLKGNLGEFVNRFGGAAGQPQNEFFATVDQALFFANGGVVQSWLAPGGGNLTERLGGIVYLKALVEEMYQSVLTRHPTDTEVVDAAQYLAARPNEKPAVVQELVWALLTSAEFRFRH